LSVSINTLNTGLLHNVTSCINDGVMTILMVATYVICVVLCFTARQYMASSLGAFNTLGADTLNIHSYINVESYQCWQLLFQSSH